MTIGEEGSAEEIGKLMEALGLVDADMLGGFMPQVSNSVSKTRNELDQMNANFALGLVKAVEPQSEVEAVLGARMAETHVCLMDASRRYLCSDTTPVKESAERSMMAARRLSVMSSVGVALFPKP